MAPSWFQILIVIVLLVLLFGRGKISDLMGDVAKGIKSFKKGIADDDSDDADADASDTVKSIEHGEEKPAKSAKAPGGKKAKAS